MRFIVREFRDGDSVPLYTDHSEEIVNAAELIDYLVLQGADSKYMATVLEWHFKGHKNDLLVGDGPGYCDVWQVA